jgi:hypothetical protein
MTKILSHESEKAIETAFSYVVSREYGPNRSIVDGEPQWIEWLARGDARKLSSDSIGVLRDSNAIAPTNLTRSRVVYILRDAPAQVKRRFSAVYEHYKNLGSSRTLALQKAVIGSCLSLPKDAESYEKCWRTFDYDWQQANREMLFLKDGSPL